MMTFPNNTPTISSKIVSSLADQIADRVNQAAVGPPQQVVMEPGACVVCGKWPGDPGKPTADFRRCKQCKKENYCSGE